MKARSTGITIALTIALAVGLSLAPVPQALRPFPSLVREPLGDALASLLLPERGGARPQEVMTGAPVAVDSGSDANADVPPGESEEEIRAAREAAGESAGTEAPPSPAATLGASGFRSVRHLERLAKEVGATHVDLESPASLERFFSKLEALQQGDRREPVRVVHLGDSQVASDHITDVIRERLQLRYGSGGRGFLFVDRPTKFAGRKVRTGEASPGWEVTLLTDKAPKGVLGFTGARFVASKTRETTEFELGDSRSAELFFATDPNGGLLEVLADGEPISSVFTRLADQNMAFTRVQIPAGAKKLRLASAEGEVSVFGVSLENDAPGVVYDSVGLPGAQFKVYLRAPENAFAAQLAKRDPALVVLMLGGNESYELGRGWVTLDDVRTHASKLIDRIREAAPEADCLLFSPLDAGIRTVGGTIEPRPHTEDVRKITREVALAKGCAYWDLLTAMGGTGSVPKWLDAKLFHSDLVHPRAPGADLMGHLFDFALERARSGRPSARNPAGGDPLGLQMPTEKPLAKTFEKLSALQKGSKDAEAVRIVQLGASHTAGHMFTDVAREQLAR
ncbi:MAG: GDSL-type esterase/lipase family protein, partial [Myxococcaceae bacterium]